LFNFITGYVDPQEPEQLAISPLNKRETLYELIDGEIGHVQAGRSKRTVSESSSIATTATASGAMFRTALSTDASLRTPRSFSTAPRAAATGSRPSPTPRATLAPARSTTALTATRRGGHIIRLREAGDNTAATGFAWDIHLFGADSAQASANVNLSGLTADNDFSSPDGLWFARPQNPAGQVRPLLWIQTDDGAFTDVTNCMMLAALPGTVGDGGPRTITNVGAGGATATQATRVGAAATAATLKRFLVGPKECEITGVDSTPDGRTLFVGIQHPGENGTATEPTSNWPQSQTGNASGRPRSAIVAITKNDGGIVGL
jgi:hypothetical protein